MTDVVTVGWLTMDDIVLTDGTCSLGVPGGGALYSAIGASLWSPSVGIHSVAGRPHHEETCRSIGGRGIDTSGISKSTGNGLELWLLHESEVHKQQVPKLTSESALNLDSERGDLPPVYSGARGFHIAPQGPASSRANAARLSALHSRPIVTMDILCDRFIDASLYEDLAFLADLSAFLPSEAEIRRIWNPPTIEGFLADNAIRHRCHMGAKLGERGALLAEAGTGKLVHVAAWPAAVVDTTGAGDAFCGGFLAGLVAGHPPSIAAAMGTVSASYVVEATGALATRRPDHADRAARLAHVAAAMQTVP
jgi:sugar/nucleoside kinase (ribokinase family)